MAQSERLGKYDIVEVLGAMGVVFKGFDPDIDRTVAIKTVRKELIEEEDRAGMALARFKNRGTRRREAGHSASFSSTGW
jgi:eukaryotic-like serine/threonine-protein kinase